MISPSFKADTKSLELPSITGGSLLFNSIKRLLTLIPAHADITCSVVCTLTPFSSIVVPRVRSTTLSISGVTTLSPLSFLINLIPVFSSAG